MWVVVHYLSEFTIIIMHGSMKIGYMYACYNTLRCYGDEYMHY